MHRYLTEVVRLLVVVRYYCAIAGERIMTSRSLRSCCTGSAGGRGGLRRGSRLGQPAPTKGAFTRYRRV